jgi:hypothetical protein
MTKLQKEWEWENDPGKAEGAGSVAGVAGDAGDAERKKA